MCMLGRGLGVHGVMRLGRMRGRRSRLHTGVRPPPQLCAEGLALYAALGGGAGHPAPCPGCNTKAKGAHLSAWHTVAVTASASVTSHSPSEAMSRMPPCCSPKRITAETYGSADRPAEAPPGSALGAKG